MSIRVTVSEKQGCMRCEHMLDDVCGSKYGCWGLGLFVTIMPRDRGLMSTARTE
jgi:hypothetical protein